MRRRLKPKPKRSVAPHTKSERWIVAAKTKRRIERKALKYRHRLLEEE